MAAAASLRSTGLEAIAQSSADALPSRVMLNKALLVYQCIAADIWHFDTPE